MQEARPPGGRHPHRACRLVLLLLLLAMIAASSIAGAPTAPLASYAAPAAGLGGDFQLTDRHGRRVGPRNWRGSVVMLAFGDTHCPDICPLTLIEFKQVLVLLGPDAARVQPVFITVDPERDTQQALASYVAYFHKSIVGLTGSMPEIRQVAGQFAAVFRKMETDSAGGYTVGHSGIIYLIDGKGVVRYLMPPDAGTPLLAAGARALLDEP